MKALPDNEAAAASFPAMLFLWRGSIRGLIFYECLVLVTPQPPLAGLGRRSYRVTGVMKMLCHVLGGRAVAAKGRAAGLAGPQMHPPAVYLPAFLAHQLVGDLNLLNIFNMLTNLLHYTSLKYW